MKCRGYEGHGRDKFFAEAKLPCEGAKRRCQGKLWLFVLALLLGNAMARGAADLLDQSLRPGLITPEERRWLDAHPVIRVAPTSNYRPVEFHDSAGQYWGMTSEYFSLIEKRVGAKFQYVRLSPEQWQKLNPIERGADVITASAETPQRAAFWSYTKPYLDFPTYLITRQNVAEDISLAKLSQARVAVVQGWAAEEYLRTQFPEVIVDPVPDAETGLRKVSFGLVDAFVSELPVATVAMEKQGIVNLKTAGEAGYTYKLSISVRKDWPELRSILEKALATITSQERDAIYRRWMKMSDPPNRFNERLQRAVVWGGLGLAAALVAVLSWNRTLASKVRERTARLDEELGRRIKASWALSAMVERFELAARATNDAVWDWDLESKSIWWYNGFQVLFGYRQDELEPGIESWINRLHPDDLERTKKGIYAVIEGEGIAWSDEYRFRRKDGSYADVLDRGYVIREKGGRAIRMIGAMQDITERKRAATALMESEERFSKAFRSSPIAMCLTTVDRGEIIEVNDAFLRMYGFQDKKLAIGRTTRELGWWAAPEPRESYVARLRSEGRILNLKRPFRRVTGDLGMGLFSVEMVEFGGVPCAIVLVNDITERERAEADRQRLFAQLLKAEDEERRRIARELHDSTSQHLAAIQMNLTRLSECANSQLLADSLALITQSVQEIRTLSYLLHPPLLEDLGLVGALSDYAAGFARRSGLRVEVDTEGYSGRLPHDVELALFRVAQESLTNVRRHSGSASALVRLERDDEEVRLEVQDSGRGLPANAPLGVGLSGMKERLRQIGGELDIESDDQGTTVLASVPLTARASMESQEASLS